MGVGHWVLLLHAASTLVMVGLIWFVQVVHYPLFEAVGREGFAHYAQAHARLTSWVVIPPMLVEAGTAGLLLLGLRPSSLGSGPLSAGALLLLLVWGSTFLLQVPRHGQLAAGFDGEAHAALVTTNWIRTSAWTLRGALVLWMLAESMKGTGGDRP
jgi:hypothetical protein